MPSSGPTVGDEAARATPLGTTGTAPVPAPVPALVPSSPVPPPLGGGPSSAGASPARPPAPVEPAPKATAAPAAARVPGRGRLMVRSTPAGAEVRVNGRVRGETPFELADLPTGRYTIEVREPGYVAQSRQVTVTSARPTAAVEMRLKPAAPPAPAAAKAGSMEIDSRPRGARVYFDGRLIGETPLVVTTVPAGIHQIRLEAAGHRAWNARVTIVAGRRERVAGSLEPQ